MDQFELQFKRADLDRDGRISGAEAVSFFQGSGLSKQILAQIWTYADQNRAGFLGRQKFFNALKLVTVAQSKRDLTPEIVKAALYGPASSKIPPPQINLPPSPTPQSPQVASSPGMQMGAVAPTTTPNLGYRGTAPPNQNMNPQYYQSPANQLVRPSQGVPTNAAPRPMQSSSGLPNSGISPSGISNSGMRPSFSMSTPGLPSSGMPTSGPSSGMLTPGIPGTGMSTPGHLGLGVPTPGRPTQGMQSPLASSGIPISGMSTAVPPNASVLTDWLGGRTGRAPSGPTPQLPNRGANSSTTLDMLMSSQASNRDSEAAPVSSNGVYSNSIGGGDPFAAFQMTRSSSSPAIPSITTTPTSSAIVSVSAPPPSSSVTTSSAIVPVSLGATPPSSNSRSFDSLQSAFGKQPLGGQPQQGQAFSNLSQPVTQVTSSGGSAAGASVDQSQPPWPKMTTPGIQKYTKVFREVDADRDGKITGDQARNLFLSWRLPREVLKQVWDLADQDSDSMLSLREFCIALYLMERYREGRSLPPSLPNSIIFDETLMRMTGLPLTTQGSAAWGATSGVGFRPVLGTSASQPVTPTAGPRPVMQSPQADMTMRFQQPKPTGLDNSQSNQLVDGEQNLSHPNFPETNEAEKKAEKVEKIVLDSREKLEYYRTKMQELVLYKSRCDNRLNEIIERASADKREADLLGKKYEEKYKQVAEIASKLTIEEAKFREYQERKIELQQAIANMETGGSADGILQVRADRIQSDFEELLKALSERCKTHGVEIKSAALIELPRGWQPGIQEGASVWDEEWDKFEDQGLMFDKEVAADGQKVNTSPESTLFKNGTYPHDDLFDPDSPSNVDAKSEKQSSRGERALDGESGYSHSEDDSARSPHGSPTHRSTLESPSQDFSDIFARSEADTDFHRGFDDQGWGTFDGTDDADSVWGFNSKDQHGDRLFDSSSFGSPRTDSPRGNTYNRRSPFADSVPGTPSISKSGNSPRFSEAGDSFFDNYSRFDSFSMNESNRFSPPRETLARFDSVSSSRSGVGHTRGFTSFDDADPFGSSGPFKLSSETPRKPSDNWSSF